MVTFTKYKKIKFYLKYVKHINNMENKYYIT